MVSCGLVVTSLDLGVLAPRTTHKVPGPHKHDADHMNGLAIADLWLELLSECSLDIGKVNKNASFQQPQIPETFLKFLICLDYSSDIIFKYIV